MDEDYNAESVATFNRHAARYAEKYFDLPQYLPHYERLADALPPGGGRCLDLACGPGNVAAHLRQRHPQAEIWGVDGAPNMLAQAQARVPGLHTLRADCRDLSALAPPFDGAAFFFGLSYFDDADAQRVLAGLHRLLRPQAPLLLATLTGDPAASGFTNTSSGDRVCTIYRRPADVSARLAEAGFAVEELSEMPSPPNASVETLDIVLFARRL
ncbi:class I SAM-dependent methyltransferase [Inhella proteolytica]|uniref:Class I SAM-dependent methyltransferase n=1 Tax=Inhella proteolytica TaxID=2795029 RepID=A0A931J2Q9_9BURK|nr:class I SAM-dependent methyltransferase [Inhella proteolytica]MBH9577075.1 class I SAM-dependent methyltransferase [Inhella proteolytica]